MDTVPWDIPATLKTLGAGASEITTFREAVEAYCGLHEADRTNAEISFIFQKNEGVLHASEIDKYVAMLD